MLNLHEQIEKVIVGHDGKEPGSEWYLKELIVYIHSRRERYVFECHRWLEVKGDDDSVACVLKPAHVEKVEDGRYILRWISYLYTSPRSVMDIGCMDIHVHVYFLWRC